MATTALSRRTVVGEPRDAQVHHGEDCGEGDQGRLAYVHLVDQRSHVER